MKCAVIGSGGVGGSFGALLALSGTETWFLARGSHLAAMRSRGLTIRTTGGTPLHVRPGRMTENPREVGPCDLVLFCVKSYDTETAAPLAAPLLEGGGTLLTLQNGAESAARLALLLPGARIWPGIAFVYASVSAPGEITETGSIRKILFGATHGGPPPPPAQEALAALGRASIGAEWTPDIRRELWKKLAFIATVGGLTALTRLTLGELLDVHRTRELLADAMEEACRVARAEGAAVEEDFVRLTIARLLRFPNRTRSSLYHDLVNGRPLEIDALSGAVVRFGVLHGIPTPLHRMMYDSLLPHHRSRGRPRTTGDTQ
ncbi:MAG: 2-dehydropantoate 2-reductase [Bacteroidota bacterium]